MAKVKIWEIEVRKPKITKIEGFRKLPWKTHINEALRAYPDLKYLEQKEDMEVRYKAEKIKKYYREKEDFNIGDINFGTIKYTFNNDLFTGVTAYNNGKIEYPDGIYNITSNNIEAHSICVHNTRSFNNMKDTLYLKYGKAKHKRDRKDESDIEYTWIIGTTELSLVYRSLHIDSFIWNWYLYINYMGERSPSSVNLGF